MPSSSYLVWISSVFNYHLRPVKLPQTFFMSSLINMWLHTIFSSSKPLFILSSIYTSVYYLVLSSIYNWSYLKRLKQIFHRYFGFWNWCFSRFMRESSSAQYSKFLLMNKISLWLKIYKLVLAHSKCWFKTCSLDIFTVVLYFLLS